MDDQRQAAAPLQATGLHPAVEEITATARLQLGSASPEAVYHALPALEAARPAEPPPMWDCAVGHALHLGSVTSTSHLMDTTGATYWSTCSI